MTRLALVLAFAAALLGSDAAHAASENVLALRFCPGNPNPGIVQASSGFQSLVPTVCWLGGLIALAAAFWPPYRLRQGPAAQSGPRPEILRQDMFVYLGIGVFLIGLTVVFNDGPGASTALSGILAFSCIGIALASLARGVWLAAKWRAAVADNPQAIRPIPSRAAWLGAGILLLLIPSMVQQVYSLPGPHAAKVTKLAIDDSSTGDSSTESQQKPPAQPTMPVDDGLHLHFYLSRVTTDPEDEAELGQVYELGLGVTRSYAEAERWYRAGAEQGNAIAQRHLASMYYDATGVPQDYREALHWYRRAALQGDTDSQKVLSTMYAQGQGGKKDDAEAYLWLRLWLKAEPQDIDVGEDIAGRLTPQQKHEVEHALEDWKPEPDIAFSLRTAAEKGDARAALALGLIYARGQGVHRDPAEAAKWLRKAADRGLPRAQLFLGSLYESGDGVAQDYAEAYFWYKLASHPITDGIDVPMGSSEMATKLSPQRKAAMDARAAAWHPAGGEQ